MELEYPPPPLLVRVEVGNEVVMSFPMVTYLKLQGVNIVLE